MRPEFWRGRRVFLTGHTGFKGGWMSLWLQHLGARVTGYSLVPPTDPCFFEEARVYEGVESIIGDIRELALLTHSLHMAQPDVVFHMAAQPLVRYSYENPIETFTTNVIGTVNLLEAVRGSSSVKAVVVVTSDKCYENREWIWGYREFDPMGGHDPYSGSKGCAELATAAYRASFFGVDGRGRHSGAIATARSGNVIGGGDWAPDRLVPDILTAFEKGMPARIRNPQAIRPWQHVLEPLCGYLTLAEKLFEQGPEFAQAWNFGPDADNAKSVEWVARTMSELWGNGASWGAIEESDRLHEATYLKLDISKAESGLGWRPSMDLRRSLELTIDWSRSRIEGADMHSYSLSQIGDYESRTAG